MIERVHEHIITELQQNARTDTIFIITAILLNLVLLAVNSIISGTDDAPTAVMGLFTGLLVVVNTVVIFGLLKGKQTRQKLVEGLLKLYKDQGIEGYYDASLLSGYNTRYNLFILAVVSLGVIAIVIPFVIRYQDGWLMLGD
jgi:hypothetical protein